MKRTRGAQLPAWFFWDGDDFFANSPQKGEWVSEYIKRYMIKKGAYRDMAKV